jgi:hypothetical protein
MKSVGAEEGAWFGGRSRMPSVGGGDCGSCANRHVWKPPPSQPAAPARGATTPTGAGTGSSGTRRMPLLASCTCARLRKLSRIAVNAKSAQATAVSGAHSRSCCDSGTDAVNRLLVLPRRGRVMLSSVTVSRKARLDCSTPCRSHTPAECRAATSASSGSGICGSGAVAISPAVNGSAAGPAHSRRAQLAARW